ELGAVVDGAAQGGGRGGGGVGLRLRLGGGDEARLQGDAEAGAAGEEGDGEDRDPDLHYRFSSRKRVPRSSRSEGWAMARGSRTAATSKVGFAGWMDAA